MSRCFAFVVASLVLVLAPPISSQSFDEALPESTRLYVGIDDVSAWWAGQSEAAFGRMLSDAAFDPIVARWEAAWEDFGLRGQEELGVNPLELLKLVQGEVALAVLDVDPSITEDGDRFPMSIGLLLGLGDDAVEFADGVDRIVERLVEEEGLVFKTESAGDVDVGVVVDPEDDRVTVRYGVSEGTFLLTIEGDGAGGRDIFDEVVAGLEGEAEVSLAATPAFSSSLAGGRGEPGRVRLWSDLGGLYEHLLAGLPGDVVDVITQLGLDGLGVLSLKSLTNADGNDSEMSLTFTSLTGILEVIAAGVSGQSPGSMRWMPDTVEGAVAVDLDFESIFDASVAQLMKHDPEAAQEFVANLSAAEDAIGFNPREDFVANLDGQLGVFWTKVDPAEGLPGAAEPMNGALLLGLRSGSSMRTMLDGLIRSQGMHAAREREEFEGFEIYHIPTPFGLSLHYAVLDDLFVLSLAPSLVKDVLRRKGNVELPALASSDAFGETSKRIPPEQTVLVYGRAGSDARSFLELADVLPMLMGATDLSRVETGLGAPGLLQDLAALMPDAAVADKYFKGASLQTLTLSEQGIQIQAASP